MTRRARLFAAFPAAWMLASIGALAHAIAAPTAGAVVLVAALVYGLPPLCWRLHDLAWPMREGRSRLDAPGYAPWWGSHQLQVGYAALPFLESALRLVPGLYSAWLRLWGSRIGHGVHWTPQVDIGDRSLLEVGDGVVFGHRSACYAHLVKPRHDGVVLYVRRIRIGDRAFIGAGSRLGPGARVAAGAVLPILTDVGVGQRIDAPR